MVDDDDVLLAAVMLPGGGRGPVGFIVGLASLIVVIALSYAACENNEECEKRQCPSGQHEPAKPAGKGGR